VGFGETWQDLDDARQGALGQVRPPGRRIAVGDIEHEYRQGLVEQEVPHVTGVPFRDAEPLAVERVVARQAAAEHLHVDPRLAVVVADEEVPRHDHAVDRQVEP